MGDLVRTIVVDSTVVTRMRRDEVIDNGKIRAGDVIVGLASFGQAVYEQEYNGGMGSNGLTSARHDVFKKDYKTKYPASFDPGVADDLVYSGDFLVTDRLKDLDVNVGKLVLSPTRTYAPVLLNVIRKYRENIHGIVHCSGGAQTKVLHFINGLHVIKDNLFSAPPLFRIIAAQSGTDWKEMYRVFNMGHRMELYVEASVAADIIKISGELGVDARIIGKVEPHEGKQVTVSGEFGTFIYN
jgi:phosphoribosylformylglycinamidine cyclo-ligase